LLCLLWYLRLNAFCKEDSAMRASDKKFFEILARHGLSVELETMSVAANRTTFGGHSTVTYYGVGQPIPQDVADAIRTEVFPLIAVEKPDFGAQNDGAVISNEILPLGEPSRRDADFAAHCALSHIGQ